MSARDNEATEAKAVAEESQTGSRETRPRKSLGSANKNGHARGLLVIGLYKLAKAIFFGALGAGALNLVHRNLGEIVLRLVSEVKIIDPEGHFASLLLDRADLIGGQQLRQASLVSFGYSLLCLIEGTGLILRKVWAEYFTVILTAAAMPWEGFEVLERYTIFKLWLLLLNFAVLLYLLLVLKKKKAEEMKVRSR
jgi:uncharacterized membrane protein (DUF2068 family)